MKNMYLSRISRMIGTAASVSRKQAIPPRFLRPLANRGAPRETRGKVGEELQSSQIRFWNRESAAFFALALGLCGILAGCAEAPPKPPIELNPLRENPASAASPIPSADYLLSKEKRSRSSRFGS